MSLTIYNGIRTRPSGDSPTDPLAAQADPAAPTTTRWTVQTALDLDIPISGITEAVFTRSLSGRTALHATGAALPGPTDTLLGERDAARLTDQANRPCPHPRSPPTPRASTRSRPPTTPTSGTSTWLPSPRCGAPAASSVPPSSTASATPTRPTPPRPVCSPTPASPKELTTPNCPGGLVMAHAARDGVPAPFAPALAHYDTLHAPRLPAALTQAERDCFAAPTPTTAPTSSIPAGTPSAPKDPSSDLASPATPRVAHAGPEI